MSCNICGSSVNPHLCAGYLDKSKPARPVVNDELGFKFVNKEPKDPEWSAHIKGLNEYCERDNIVRQIIQYARSGPFYPADMHVDLIDQLLVNHKVEAYKKGYLDGGLSAIRSETDYQIDRVKKEHRR